MGTRSKSRPVAASNPDPICWSRPVSVPLFNLFQTIRPGLQIWIRPGLQELLLRPGLHVRTKHGAEHLQPWSNRSRLDLLEFLQTDHLGFPVLDSFRHSFFIFNLLQSWTQINADNVFLFFTTSSQAVVTWQLWYELLRPIIGLRHQLLCTLKTVIDITECGDM